MLEVSVPSYCTPGRSNTSQHILLSNMLGSLFNIGLFRVCLTHRLSFRKRIPWRRKLLFDLCWRWVHAPANIHMQGGHCAEKKQYIFQLYHQNKSCGERSKNRLKKIKSHISGKTWIYLVAAAYFGGFGVSKKKLIKNWKCYSSVKCILCNFKITDNKF